jgi:MFS family permease
VRGPESELTANAPDSTRPSTTVVALLVAAAIIGLGLRLWVLATPLGETDADEAIVGLMAEAVLDGDVDTFYTGQAYGGSQEALLTAVVFSVTGPSTIALKSVMVALSAVAVALTWFVGRRTVGLAGAALAAALLWCGPPLAVWLTTKARAFYGLSAVLALVGVLLCLRLAEEPRRRDAALLGLAAGCAWWSSPQGAVIIGVAGAWVLWRQRAALRLVGWTIAFAIVGALPWLSYNLRNSWQSLDTPPSADPSPAHERLLRLFTDTIPSFVGVRDHASDQWVPAAIAIVVLGALGAAVVWWMLRTRGDATVITWVLLVFPIFYTANPFTSFAEARYLLVVAPFLSLVVGSVIATLVGDRRAPAVGIGIVAALAVLAVVRLDDLSDRTVAAAAYHDITPGDMDALIDTLLDEDADHVWADYWTAPRLRFESGGDVVASGFGFYRGDDALAAMLATPDPAYVLYAGSANATRLLDHLDAEGIGVETFEVGRWIVIVPDDAVPKDSLPPGTLVG